MKWALHCFKFRLITQNNARPRNVQRRVGALSENC